MQQVSRYHPLLVMLHWLLAVLIIAALAVGFFVLAAMPNADPQKIAVLRVHMAGGMLILALMVIRFAVRMWTSRPPVRDDRLCPPGSDRADHLLRLLRPGPLDGGQRLHNGNSCGAPGDRFRRLRRPAANRPSRFIRALWHTAILRRSLPASSFCTCLPRSTINSL